LVRVAKTYFITVLLLLLLLVVVVVVVVVVKLAASRLHYFLLMFVLEWNCVRTFWTLQPFQFLLRILKILLFLVGFYSKNYHPISYALVEDCIVRVVNISVKEIFTLYRVLY